MTNIFIYIIDKKLKTFLALFLYVKMDLQIKSDAQVIEKYIIISSRQSYDGIIVIIIFGIIYTIYNYINKTKNVEVPLIVEQKDNSIDSLKENVEKLLVENSNITNDIIILRTHLDANEVISNNTEKLIYNKMCSMRDNIQSVNNDVKEFKDVINKKQSILEYNIELLQKSNNNDELILLKEKINEAITKEPNIYQTWIGTCGDYQEGCYKYRGEVVITYKKINTYLENKEWLSEEVNEHNTEIINYWITYLINRDKRCRYDRGVYFHNIIMDEINPEYCWKIDNILSNEYKGKYTLDCKVYENNSIIEIKLTGYHIYSYSQYANENNHNAYIRGCFKNITWKKELVKF